MHSVLIVGGGIGGATAALMHQRGIEVTVTSLRNLGISIASGSIIGQAAIRGRRFRKDLPQ